MGGGAPQGRLNLIAETATGPFLWPRVSSRGAVLRRGGEGHPTGQRSAQRENGESRRLAPLRPRGRPAVSDAPRVRGLRGGRTDDPRRHAASCVLRCGGRPGRVALHGPDKSGRPEARSVGRPPDASKGALSGGPIATHSPRALSRARRRPLPSSRAPSVGRRTAHAPRRPTRAEGAVVSLRGTYLTFSPCHSR